MTRKLRLLPPVTAVVLVAVVVAMVLLLNGDGPETEASEAHPARFAEVVLTDLVSQETYQATLGSTAADPVVTRIAGTVTSIPTPGDVVAQGETLFAVDGRPVVLLFGEVPAFRDIAMGQDRLTVSSRLPGTVTWVAPRGTVVQQGDVLFRIDDRPVVFLGGAIPAYRDLSDVSPDLSGTDVLQLEQALVALGFDPSGSVEVDGRFNYATSQMVKRWQKSLGLPSRERDGVVSLGEVIFLPGPCQVLQTVAKPGEAAGGPVLEVSTGEAAHGPDVLQFEQALVALGHDAGGALVADGVFSPETTQGILSLQAATGQERDGIVDSGEVVFGSRELRVIEQLAAEGSRLEAGSSVLGISLSEKVVRMALPADRQGSVAAGDAVTVEMPDRSRVAAKVASISKTATAAPDTADAATFDVLVRLDDPIAAGNLDEAPVRVLVVSGSVKQVTAVPVSALVALLEGGYAVEVDSGQGGTRLVGVEPGFFGSNNMVQVDSSELKAGDRVLVP